MGSRTGVLLRDMRVCVCVCGGSDYLPRLPFSHLPPHRLILTLREKSGTKERRGHGEETEWARALSRRDTFSCPSWNIVHHHINRAERGEIRPVEKKVSRMSPWDISILTPPPPPLYLHSLFIHSERIWNVAGPFWASPRKWWHNHLPFNCLICQSLTILHRCTVLSPVSCLQHPFTVK